MRNDMEFDRCSLVRAGGQTTSTVDDNSDFCTPFGYFTLVGDVDLLDRDVAKKHSFLFPHRYLPVQRQTRFESELHLLPPNLR